MKNPEDAAGRHWDFSQNTGSGLCSGLIWARRVCERWIVREQNLEAGMVGVLRFRIMLNYHNPGRF